MEIEMNKALKDFFEKYKEVIHSHETIFSDEFDPIENSDGTKTPNPLGKKFVNIRIELL